MRILISGASGFVGSYLTQFLAQQGHEVLRLVRRALPGPGEITWDPEHGKLDPAAFFGVDAVINLSGAGLADKRWNADYKQTIITSRTSATGLLAATLARAAHPPQLFISFSAVGWYGAVDGDTALTEDSPPGTGFLAEVAQHWEAAAGPARAAGIRVVHPRLGLVIGPGGALEKMLPQFKLGLGGRLGSGRQIVSWIALDDIGPAMLHVFGHPELHGPVNFTAPNAVSNADFARALGELLGRGSSAKVPAFALRLAIGEAADELLLRGQRVLPARLLNSGYRFSQESMRDTLAYYLPRFQARVSD